MYESRLVKQHKRKCATDNEGLIKADQEQTAFRVCRKYGVSSYNNRFLKKVVFIDCGNYNIIVCLNVNRDIFAAYCWTSSDEKVDWFHVILSTVYICMEKLVVSVRNQMEKALPLETFAKNIPSEV